LQEENNVVRKNKRDKNENKKPRKKGNVKKQNVNELKGKNIKKVLRKLLANKEKERKK